MSRGIPNRKKVQVPCGPIIEWIEQRIAYHENRFSLYTGGKYRPTQDPSRSKERHYAKRMVRQELGWPERKLWRIRNRRFESKHPDGSPKVRVTDTFPLDVIEEGLFNAGVFLWEVYPMDEFPELYGDESLARTWCTKHQEEVFVDERGECLWCLGEREAKGRGRARARDERYRKNRAAA